MAIEWWEEDGGKDSTTNCPFSEVKYNLKFDIFFPISLNIFDVMIQVYKRIIFNYIQFGIF